MIASSMWIDGPILWLLAILSLIVFLCVCEERRERRIARQDKDQQAEIIPITKGRKL